MPIRRKLPSEQEQNRAIAPDEARMNWDVRKVTRLQKAGHVNVLRAGETCLTKGLITELTV